MFCFLLDIVFKISPLKPLKMRTSCPKSAPCKECAGSRGGRGGGLKALYQCDICKGTMFSGGVQ